MKNLFSIFVKIFFTPYLKVIFFIKIGKKI